MENASANVDHATLYASALLNIAAAETDSEAAVDEMYRALHGLSRHPELIETLADTRMPAEIKQGIVEDILEARASRVTVAAVSFIVASGHAKRAGDIAVRIAELAAEAEGEVVAEVRSPFELDAEQTERLRVALANATGKRIQIKLVVDPSVIGGVVAKIGDTVLDGSVQHRFTELREQWG